MVQALYRKWRPQTFDEVVGQEHIVRTLRNALTTGRIHHAYLLTGPRGTGKTTSARLLAKAVNCLAEAPEDRPCNVCEICQAVNEGRLMDLIEIDAASNTGVDDVRELRERVGFRPNLARYKVYVIDEVHMLSNAAFNALLKTLEEPPPHAIFVLATTEPQKIPATILSRCQRFDFHRISLDTIVDRLAHIAASEGIPAERDALAVIARQSTGSMRDAESLLDQLAAYNAGGITVEGVRAALGTGADASVFELTDALAGRDVSAGLCVINETIEQGSDPRQFARQVVQHLRLLMLVGLGSEPSLLHVPPAMREAFKAQAARFDPKGLARAVRLFNDAASEGRTAWQPQLPLELALVEATLPDEPQSPPPSSPPPPARPVPAPSPAPTRPRATKPPASPPASPPPSEAAPATALPASDSSVTLERIAGLWSEVLGALHGRNRSLEALLRSGRPVGVEDDVVVVGFEYEFHQGKASEDGNRRLAEEVLSELLAQKVRVRCALVQADAPSPANRAPKSASHAPDELVQAAVNQLGARVRDVE
ncbi:MAG: DNA polymerase III subunit gamma/tau [Anaerolineae bacterium]|nr:DNA polymerase III subunit gamma/tau [Anaerolineae bacterium]